MRTVQVHFLLAGIAILLVLTGAPATAATARPTPAGGAAVPYPTTAGSGTAASTGPYRIGNLSSRRCLDADTGTVGGNGTTVQLWDCHPGGQPNQHWFLDSTETYSLVRIRNRESGKCLDADAGTIGGNGTRVQLWDCHGRLNQDWYLETAVSHGLFRIRNRDSGKCLDADTGTIGGNGTRVQLWDCLDPYTHLNQIWFLDQPGG